jgi:hypothetical protein
MLAFMRRPALPGSILAVKNGRLASANFAQGRPKFCIRRLT